MSNDNKSNGAQGGRAIAPRTGTPGQDPFGSWLQRQLHAMYDEVIGEPLPNSLLELIDNDAASDCDKKGNDVS